MAVTSGTAALVCGLQGIGIGPGDEVIVPAYTWIASAAAIVAAGGIPVIAEVDETLLLDPADVERKITPFTKAIMPVHMRGAPCRMDELMAPGERARSQGDRGRGAGKRGKLQRARVGLLWRCWLFQSSVQQDHHFR